MNFSGIVLKIFSPGVQSIRKFNSTSDATPTIFDYYNHFLYCYLLAITVLSNSSLLLKLTIHFYILRPISLVSRLFFFMTNSTALLPCFLNQNLIQGVLNSLLSTYYDVFWYAPAVFPYALPPRIESN